MSNPVRFLSSQIKADSWVVRIRENLHQLLIPTGCAAPAAGDGAFQGLRFGPTKRTGGAQTLSLITHGAALGLLALLALHPKLPPVCVDCQHAAQIPLRYTPPLERLRQQIAGIGGNESGGHREPLPATSGNLPPHSPNAFVPPRVPVNAIVKLPVPQEVLDKEAPELVPVVTQVGLPWMAHKTDSNGPGDGRSIGNGPGDSPGDGPNGGKGHSGVPGEYGRAAVDPTCAYCPNPAYTDEARHEKIQGSVMLQVLVGVDGLAQDVRVSRGLGLGLDERAAQTIRGWHFHPAKDGSGRPVAAWITIETVFRLF